MGSVWLEQVQEKGEKEKDLSGRKQCENSWSGMSRRSACSNNSEWRDGQVCGRVTVY